MNIHGNPPYNFDPHLQLLFNAMSAGKTINSITCMAGSVNKDDRSKDFEIKNFVMSNYYVGMQSNYEGTEYYDYVTGLASSSKDSFYMNWIIKFEI